MADSNTNAPPSSSLTFPPHLSFLTKLKVRLTHLFYNTFLRQNGTLLSRSIINLLLPKTPPNRQGQGVLATDHQLPNNLTFRIFTPQNHQQKLLPLIIYFHGGGFFIQTADSSSCHAFAANLSTHLPAVVASLTYRLSPEHKYPAQHQDAFDFIRHLSAHPHILPSNTDLSNTFLAGESAGANLAHFAAVHCFSSSSSSSQTTSTLTLKGLVSIQPFFGGEERTGSELRLLHGLMLPVWVTDWMWKAYLPEGADRDHAACNVSGSNNNGAVGLSEGFPRRSLVVVGGFDPLRDWQRRYVEWLRRAGKEVDLIEFENGMHGFYVFPELKDQTHLLYDQVKKFVYKMIQ